MSNTVFQGWRSPANRLGFAVFSLFVVAALLTPVSLAAQTANPLLEMLKSPNADTRARAARDIGKSGERSAIPALAEALKDPSEKVRRNITEGKPGSPLDLRLTVVDASTCKPIKSAVVDIWHADSLGVYSGAIANNQGTPAVPEAAILAE